MTNRSKRVSARELAAETPDAGTDAAPPETPMPVARAKQRTPKPLAKTRAALPKPIPERAPQVQNLQMVDYKPDPKRHMSQMGPVASSNWTGIIAGVRHRVRMGAPQSTVPKHIQELMRGDGVEFYVAEPPPGSGAVLVKQPPRARRTERANREQAQRRSSPVRGISAAGF